jgi:FtsP/CotA-like multicopper oxidase with cupredoxin domain
MTMSRHDHEHMPKQQPEGANDHPRTDATAGDGAKHGGHAGHPAAEEPAAQQPATAPAGDGHTGQRDGQSSHAGMGHGDTDHMGMSATIPLAYRPTRAQIAVVSFLSVLALTAAVIFSASYANLRLSARDVGGAIMPPGMIMTYDTPGQSMRDMAAVDPRTVSYTAPADARGDQPLEPRIENSVKVFGLDVSVIKWNILPYEQVMAYAFNRQVPGPRLRVTEGDRVRINVTNHLPEATSVHWHGLILPNQMDGPAEITQAPIEPGQTYTYEFTTQQAGTFFYHTHKEPDRQQALGMYGALIIDPKDPSSTPAHDLEYTIQLQEWLEKQGYTYPAMLMEGALPNFFTINGKAYPATDTIQMKVGQKVLLRFIGSNNNFVHPMHVHGGPFTIVGTDGNPVPQAAQITKDTVNVGPGERYDVIWTAREPGRWLLHCHIPHHTTNDNVEEQGAGGLTLIINVTP